jgi:Tfp pilus assembly protein PilN
MSQQLNLLPRGKTGFSPAAVALLILGLVAFGLFSTWGVKRSILATTRAEEAASAAQLKEVTAQLEERFRARAAQLNAEISALTPRAEEAKQVLALAAEVGKIEGYSPYFSSLAMVREEGVWLTEAKVSKAGKSLQLGGLALDKDAVIRYSERLNAAFANSDVQLNALEMKVETVPAGSPSSSAGLAPLNPIKFTLR